MKRLRKFVAGVLVASFLLQPLGLVSPVFAETVEMKYTDPEHLHAPKEVNRVVYQYDKNGNLENDGERIISWNQDNMPTKIVRGDQEVELFYDADGRRIVKKIGENRTVYVNQYLAIEQLNNETIPQKHYFANARIAQEVSGNLNFLYQNYLGSTVLATDSNSQFLEKTISYFPYGNTISNQQSAISNYLFTGQEIDDELDLYNYNARLYNPKVGAFISADTVGEGNRYAYAENNPVIFTDPTGNQSLGERVESFLGEVDIPPEWQWLRYTMLINPFFYFDKFIEKPIAEKYNISASLTIGTVSVLGASAYEGAKWLSFAKDYYRETIMTKLGFIGREGMYSDLKPAGKPNYQRLITETTAKVRASEVNLNDPDAVAQIVSQEVNKAMKFNLKFTGASMEMSARFGRGVCYHKAGLGAAVMEELGYAAGVEVFGPTGDIAHAVTQYYNPNLWTWSNYFDPTTGSGTFTSGNEYGSAFFGADCRFINCASRFADPVLWHGK